MREIKFRAWDKQDKRMYEWPFIVHHFDHEIRVNRDNKLTYVPMEDVCLMLFTGLKDKFGKEIYEGDIIKGQIETMQFIKGRVYLETEHGRHWGCMIADGPEEKQFGSWDMRQLCWGVDEYTPHCEVIGNIYENPELIGERNEIKW